MDTDCDPVADVAGVIDLVDDDVYGVNEAVGCQCLCFDLLMLRKLTCMGCLLLRVSTI